MAESLKNKAISGAKWKTSLNIGRYFISFFLSIILARLLEPREFGLIGMVAILSAIAQIFIDSGLSQAVIRQKNVTDQDYSTVFYFNIVVSSLFYALFYFSAPWVAEFYNEPELVKITRLITIVFLINSVGTIQNSILVREIKFKKQALCNFAGLIVSVIIGGIMAFKGYGVYSIVAQALSQATVTNALFWITSDWRPSGGFSKEVFKKLWGFASNILATNIVVRIIDNIDKVLIAKVFSASQLGYYVKARSSTDANQIIFTETLNATSFAVMVKGNRSKEELQRYHNLFFKIGVFAFIPIIFGFIATAESFIVVLYSDKWLPSVPIAQIIALIGITYFLDALFLQTVIVDGKGRMFFWLKSGKKLLTLITIPVGIFMGFFPFLWSLVLVNYLGLFINFYFVGKIVNNHWFVYVKYMAKPFLLALLMGLVVYSITYLPLNSYIITLFLQMFTGFIFYIGFSKLFDIVEYRYLKDIVLEQSAKFSRVNKVLRKII